MIKLDDIKLSPRIDGEKELRRVCAKRIGCGPNDIGDIRILRRSIDARKKDAVSVVYSVECALLGETLPVHSMPQIQIHDRAPDAVRPVVVGSGPAGMFCALTLARAGVRPIILERGQPVEQRTKTVSRYFDTGVLDSECNVQFGEGGAGTFSDGKLTTGIKDSRISVVINTFIEHGAPEEIAWQSKPHIGTDRLRAVVAGIRGEVESLGGEYIFGARLDDIIVRDGALKAICYVKKSNRYEQECDRLVLATGHSARDTFAMLYERGVVMEQKSFSVGARIEHPQALIDLSQYGKYAGMPALGAADYKLAAKARTGRGVYTFCMCPGGRVVAAASEPDSVATNGMSLYARNDTNANSAVLVSVTPEDYGSDHPLAGIEMQRGIERAAYRATGSACAPAQLVGDLLAGRASTGCGSVEPSYRPGVVFGDIRCCLPRFVVEGIADGCLAFERRLRGFSMYDAVLTAPETRSSSPVRIRRDEQLQASISGVYPCGEGAGYAGGIVSAAVDGIRCAQAILEA